MYLGCDAHVVTVCASTTSECRASPFFISASSSLHFVAFFSRACGVLSRIQPIESKAKNDVTSDSKRMLCALPIVRSHKHTHNPVLACRDQSVNDSVKTALSSFVSACFQAETSKCHTQSTAVCAPAHEPAVAPLNAKTPAIVAFTFFFFFKKEHKNNLGQRAHTRRRWRDEIWRRLSLLIAFSVSLCLVFLFFFSPFFSSGFFFL